ncbi:MULTISPECIES: hypothetical protein [Dyella]|uniref:Uncharacterized protein n=2 Tax=Dyella TaxID=231454 RepID=A0A4R0YTZ6_9GAMM|nr:MULTISPECIES: hypothetical protein [Dyella]TBR40508.1 hypothetical protein EYV96_10245 [Dyella terrae]TCI11911.1 hypothetical protein EZM97_00625 [Dyella soli]
MHYDQSWMGFGLVGGLQAGAIATVVGLLAYLMFNWIGGRSDWGQGARIGWSYLLGLMISGSGDMWDMFYFNYARLQSLQLLKAKLAQVHDPDGIGTRVFFELMGVALGIYIGWVIAGRRRSKA